jgi:hypothetical protein
MKYYAELEEINNDRDHCKTAEVSPVVEADTHSVYIGLPRIELRLGTSVLDLLGGNIGGLQQESVVVAWAGIL